MRSGGGAEVQAGRGTQEEAWRHLLPQAGRLGEGSQRELELNCEDQVGVEHGKTLGKGSSLVESEGEFGNMAGDEEAMTREGNS